MKRRTCLLATVVVLAGCTNSPIPTLKPSDVPASFRGPNSSSKPTWPSVTWWEGFNDPQLTGLIERAQSANLDIYQAAARVRQADARARQAGAALLPTVGLNASATTLYGEASGISQHETDYSAALGVSYDLDFWGKNRDAVDSAKAARNASAADRAVVALTVTASVASTYFQLLGIGDRLEIARANLRSSQAILSVVNRRVSAGYAANADLIQEQANMAAQQAAIPALEQQEIEAQHALAILIGVPPEAFAVKPAQLAAITIPAVQPGLPSELLLRRPDVASAEANLIGAHADLSIARKAFLPDISLTGAAGVAYPALAAAVDTLPGFGMAANGGATLAQAIFDGGRLRGKIEESEAREDELLGAYRLAVISSFSDVENALNNVSHLEQQQHALELQVSQSEKVLSAAQRKYVAGYADFLTITDAQKGLYSARDQLADIRRARLAAIVVLFKSLGGGWGLDARNATTAKN